MKTHVLKGSKQEIADRLVQIKGEVREAIVFKDESAPPLANIFPSEPEDIFAEMASFMVDTPKIDVSREAIYTRVDGE